MRSRTIGGDETRRGWPWIGSTPTIRRDRSLTLCLVGRYVFQDIFPASDSDYRHVLVSAVVVGRQIL